MRTQGLVLVHVACLGLLPIACSLPTPGDPGGGGEPPPPADPRPPTLVSADARQAGRFGDHVRIDVVGRDPEGNVPALRVVLMDSGGDEVRRYDLDGDGVADSGETTVALNLPIVAAGDQAGIVYLENLARDAYDATRFRVSLVDHQGLVSEPLEIALEVQPVLGRDALCDPTFVENRCADGLSCRGETPVVCVDGEAPAITRAAYVDDELGPRVLVEGTDLDDDAVGVRVEFFDGEGNGVSVDLDNDGTPESSHFTFDQLQIATAGSFFYRFDPSENFAAIVSRLSLVVTDRGERSSDAVEVDLAAAEVKNIGADCDPRGFDRCRSSVCTPGIVGERNRCMRTDVAQRAACANAPVLTPTSGPQSVRGAISQPSLWDAPAGCVSNDPILRADGVVKVVLERDVSALRLSTGDAYTSFDSVLYLLSDCTAAPVLAWCRDDQQDAPRPWLARLEVRDLPAGEYFVVVDSFPPIASGGFQLDMLVE